MKTLCIMDSVSRANGGIFEAERRLQQTLQGEMGVEVQVVGLQDEFTESDREGWSPLKVASHIVQGPQAFGFASGFLKTLLNAEADLAYTVGLWKYPSVASLQWMRRTGKPTMIAPHGMLDPWAVLNSRWKKQIVHALFEGRHLRRASCIRALCEPEAAGIRAYGLRNPIAIIPNGIDLPELGETSTNPGHPVARLRAGGRKVLLYLGRIHPKKGLLNLVHAWAAIPRLEEWVLAIAGWDQGGHEGELQRAATSLGIDWEDARALDLQQPLPQKESLLFLGPQFGNNKAECYRGCDAFILPSFSEGLPMVILEAWAYGKPVLMTPECNLPEGFSAGAAVRIETAQEGIQQGLKELFALSDTKRMEMGAHGRNLVAQRFTWTTIAAEMKRVYEWMLGGGGPRPESMRIE